jgi:hypothetical protein
MQLVLEKKSCIAMTTKSLYFCIDRSSYKQSPPQEKAFCRKRHLLTILPGKRTKLTADEGSVIVLHLDRCLIVVSTRGEMTHLSHSEKQAAVGLELHINRITSDEENTSTSDAVAISNMKSAAIERAVATRHPYALSKTPTNKLPIAVSIGA